MHTIDLNATAWEEVHPDVWRRVINGRRMTLTFYRFGPGATYPMHHHDQEQLAFVVRGAITFHNAGVRVSCQPNHIMVISPNEPHAATADRMGAELISVVSPPRAYGTIP